MPFIASVGPAKPRTHPARGIITGSATWLRSMLRYLHFRLNHMLST